MSLGEKIRELRKADLDPKAPGRITQESLAHEAGISVSTLQRIESGAHQPRLDTLRALAKALDVPARELLEAADDS
jgi:transcriptional regulator with XRE-family HTH domain